MESAAQQKASIERLKRARAAVAELIKDNRNYLPIFSRLDTEIELLETMMKTDDPVEHARALSKIIMQSPPINPLLFQESRPIHIARGSEHDQTDHA